MSIMASIHNRAVLSGKNIILPEGDDLRVRDAAFRAVSIGIKNVTIISDNPLKGVSTIKPEASPLSYGLNLLSKGKFDGLVAGALHKTSDVLRGAIRDKELRGDGLISSFFLMETPLMSAGENGAFLFADCAVIPDPNPEKLAAIALSTAKSAEKILGWEPRVALLSFSTKGSASNSAVEKVRTAVSILKKKNPGFRFDGELQLDAAIIPDIASSKDPGGDLKGRANILIFPDLNSGNIGYKLTQRFASSRAVGPILQGFSRPVNDLSRGCSVSDIVDVIAFTALQA